MLTFQNVYNFIVRVYYTHSGSCLGCLGWMYQMANVLKPSNSDFF